MKVPGSEHRAPGAERKGASGPASVSESSAATARPVPAGKVRCSPAKALSAPPFGKGKTERTTKFGANFWTGSG